MFHVEQLATILTTVHQQRQKPEMFSAFNSSRVYDILWQSIQSLSGKPPSQLEEL